MPRFPSKVVDYFMMRYPMNITMNKLNLQLSNINTDVLIHSQN